MTIEISEPRFRRMKPYTVAIHYTNGSGAHLDFSNYHTARSFYRHGISYSGGRVRRVELHEFYGGVRTIWDIEWDAVSQAAGLNS